MRPRSPDAPQRVLDAAAQMLARVGLNATSIREVNKLADAPLGSTYHHFPGGKQEVLARATTAAGDRVEAVLADLLAQGGQQGLALFLARWRERLVATDYCAGCPILAAAVEDPVDAGESRPRAAAAAVFLRWRQLLSAAFVADGHPAADADALATLVIASVEGAVAMSRALQDIAPFDEVAAQLLRATAVRP